MHEYTAQQLHEIEYTCTCLLRGHTPSLEMSSSLQRAAIMQVPNKLLGGLSICAQIWRRMMTLTCAIMRNFNAEQNTDVHMNANSCTHLSPSQAQG